MRRGVLICEGSTDFALLQYYMRKAHGWEDAADRELQSRCIRNPGQRSRMLVKGEDQLTIMASGGSTRIPEALGNVVKRMRNTPPDGSYVYENVVIITDRDEVTTEASMLNQIMKELTSSGADVEDELSCNAWANCHVVAKTDLEYSFRILVLIIPFEDCGAMETFLLHAISAQDAYDKEVVEKAECFVDSADSERRYLTKRGYVTKAKFDAFFSVRTAVSQFNERQNIMLSVDWENYELLNDCFKQLREL